MGGLLLSTIAAPTLLALPRAVAALPPGLWDFDPLYSPAPRNDSLRPPIAKDAFTDPSLLKYQILGIVGGYVIFTLFIFASLMTCGRRWRRSAQSSHGTLSMEMVKPNRWMGDTSPAVKSVSSFRKWGKNSTSNTPLERSPISASTGTFDAAILQSHKEKQDMEMERLYAAVLNGDTKSPRSVRSASMRSTSTKEHEAIAANQGHTRTLSNSSRSFSQRRPPQLQAQAQEGTGSPPLSPRSPGNPALYPPYGPMPSDPGAPLFSVNDVTVHSQEQQRAISPRSFQTHSRQLSDTSIKSKTTATSRKSKNTRSMKKLTISAPIPTNRYPGDSADDEEARTPLSPKTPPIHHRPITPIEDHSNAEEDVYDEYDYDGIDRRRPLPPAAPQHQRHNGESYDPKSPPPLPPPPQDLQSTNPLSQHSISGPSTNTLPFRAYANNGNTTANANASARSSTTVTASSPTKTTMLSPRRDRLPPKSRQQGHPLGFVSMTPTGGQSTAGLYSAGLGSAGMATPYSPYMPFSPVTPVTPRLTTREDRRTRRREEGRRVACAEEDAVKDEKEMWGGDW